MATTINFTTTSGQKSPRLARRLGADRFALLLAALLPLAGLWLSGCHREEGAEQEPSAARAAGGANGSTTDAKAANEVPLPDKTDTALFGDERPPVFVKRREQTSQFDDKSPRIRWQEKVFSDDSTKNDGPYKEWHPNGKVFIEGQYVDGLKEGKWTLWHENGVKAKTENYVHGKMDGQWTLYREDGTKDQDVSYKANLMDGIWIRYDKTGAKPIKQTEFKADKPEGTWVEWYPSGRKYSEQHFHNGLLDGVFTIWFDNDTHQKKQEQWFKDGLQHGKMTVWKETGEKTKETEFNHGKLVTSESDTKK